MSSEMVTLSQAPKYNIDSPTVQSIEPTPFVSGRQSLSKDEQHADNEAGALFSATTTEDWKAGKQEWAIILCLSIINTMVALDASIVVPPLPNIAADIGANSVEAFWVGSAYLVPYAVFQPLLASLSDIFGRREALLFSVVSFAVGSIVAALAHDVTQMLAGRVVQGVGGGGILCLTYVIITDVIPLRKRPAYLAIPQSVWAIGTIAGPLLGGALAHHWRWCFWINLPFAGISLAITPFVVRLKREDELTFLKRLISVDWIGAILFIGGLTSFLVGLSWGGLEFSWSSYHTLVPLILGAVFTVIALVWEVKLAKDPFIRLDIYQNYSAICAMIGTFFQGFTLYGGLYAWNIYFQGVKGKSPIGTGVALLPIMLSTVPSTMITSRLIARIGKFQYFAIAGWVMVVLGNGLVIMWDLNTSTAAWVIIQIVCGASQGIILIALNIALQSHVDRHYVGQAAAIYSFLRALGLAVGVAICGTTLENCLRNELSERNLPTSIANNIAGYIVTLNHLPVSQHSFASAVRLAIASAHKNVYELIAGVVGFAFLLTLGLKSADMNQSLASKHLLEKQPEKARPEHRDLEADQVQEIEQAERSGSVQ